MWSGIFAGKLQHRSAANVLPQSVPYSYPKIQSGGTRVSSSIMSGPSAYKFNNAGDSNDAGALYQPQHLTKYAFHRKSKPDSGVSGYILIQFLDDGRVLGRGYGHICWHRMDPGCRLVL